ncbi:MAG: hypothetical protein IT458_00120 [Planctomycetes bacterium]|nr:hypothetical protein [Planctomycetota bacterium]
MRLFTILGLACLPVLPLAAQRVTISHEIDYAAKRVTFTFGVWGEPLADAILYVASSTKAATQVPGFLGWSYLTETIIESSFRLDAMGHASFSTPLSFAAWTTSYAFQAAYWDSQAGRMRFADNYALFNMWSGAGHVLAGTFNSETSRLRFSGRYVAGAELQVHRKNPGDKTWTHVYTRRGSILPDVDVSLTLLGHAPGGSIRVSSGGTTLLLFE